MHADTQINCVCGDLGNFKISTIASIGLTSVACKQYMMSPTNIMETCSECRASSYINECQRKPANDDWTALRKKVIQSAKISKPTTNYSYVFPLKVLAITLEPVWDQLSLSHFMLLQFKRKSIWAREYVLGSVLCPHGRKGMKYFRFHWNTSASKASLIAEQTIEP